ncbi:MAG: DNA adenine methylase [Ruminococcus sp.]|nr:DNA adenine methylase [Ruminococcus sp.]
MKSFIPWMGGKTLLAKKITSLFPEDFDRYIEVFGGGGSVLFHKESHTKLEIYNDLNGQLVNLFRCAKYHRAELQREISGYFNSREMFGDIKERLEMRGFTDIQRAGMFFVLVKTSYASETKSFGCNRKNLSADCLEPVEKRLANVVIENRDFEDLIKIYDRPTALFYCDPPYHKTELRFKEKFPRSDHERLRRVLGDIKGKFLLSYNDDGYIRDLYRDFEIISVERQNNLCKGYYKELIIKNF